MGLGDSIAPVAPEAVSRVHTIATRREYYGLDRRSSSSLTAGELDDILVGERMELWRESLASEGRSAVSNPAIRYQCDARNVKQGKQEQEAEGLEVVDEKEKIVSVTWYISPLHQNGSVHRS